MLTALDGDPALEVLAAEALEVDEDPVDEALEEGPAEPEAEEEAVDEAELDPGRVALPPVFTPLAAS